MQGSRPVAILGGGVFVLDAARDLPPDPHLGDLAELGRSDPDRVVWIHADALAELGLPLDLPGDPDRLARHGAAGFPIVERAIAAGYGVAPAGLAPWMVIRGSRGWRIDLAVPAWIDGGELGRLPSGGLRRALALFAGAAGVPYRRTPGTTGADLLRALRRRRPLGRGAAPPEIASDGSLEADISWDRLPTPAERERLYLHAFDSNARYLASCAALELGRGEPEELTPARGSALGFDPRVPGYHHAEIALDRLPDLLRLAIDPLRSKDPAGAWYTTPTIELARELGYVPRILRSLVWPDHGRILEPFYRRIRDGRASLSALARSTDLEVADAAGAALSILKRTYTNVIGGFAGYWRTPGDELYRPDWRHAIIANARANLIRRIRRAGVDPIAIHVDGLVIASDQNAADAGAGLGLGDGPGAFRHVGSATMRLYHELSGSPEERIRTIRRSFAA